MSLYINDKHNNDDQQQKHHLGKTLTHKCTYIQTHMYQHEDYLQINTYIHQSIGTILCETENRGVEDQYLYFQDS